MVYLDTGCLVKLYYPEQDSALIASAVFSDSFFSVQQDPFGRLFSSQVSSLSPLFSSALRKSVSL